MEQAERAARASALESLAERLTLVAEITEVLGQTLEVDEALARLSRGLAPRLADWAAVDLRVGSRQVHRVAVTGPESREAWQEDWRGHLPPVGEATHSPLVQVLNGGAPVLEKRVDLDAPPDSPLATVHSAFLGAAGAASVFCSPTTAPRSASPRLASGWNCCGSSVSRNSPRNGPDGTVKRPAMGPGSVFGGQVGGVAAPELRDCGPAALRVHVSRDRWPPT
ncbi:hypothetical protein [Streptomyces sp. NPDC053069]|uniref:hypothetical protein n=1 Tax=Streptomyces sp. NPDC053069 TaxID=3365695 RepID=UPI0037D76D93